MFFCFYVLGGGVHLNKHGNCWTVVLNSNKCHYLHKWRKIWRNMLHLYTGQRIRKCKSKKRLKHLSHFYIWYINWKKIITAFFQSFLVLGNSVIHRNWSFVFALREVKFVSYSSFSKTWQCVRLTLGCSEQLDQCNTSVASCTNWIKT